MKKGLKGIAAIWILIVVALVSARFTLTLAGADDAPARLVTQEEYEMIARYRRLEEVRQALTQDYYRELDEDALMLGAIRGMLAVPEDPYTFYYTPEELKRATDQGEGVYHGVGMLVQMTDAGMEIVQVYDGTPAQAAGLQPGDLITAVDGTAISADTQQSFNEAVAKIQGEDGSEVTLTLLRDGRLMDATMRRAQLNIPHVYHSLLPGGIGYAAITQFSGDDVEGFERALEALKSAGVSGVILDLRNNPGGYLDHVVGVCSQVLPNGILTYVEDRHGRRTEEYSSGDPWMIPMVVLVNENSASGSELFTAAFQDYKRGTVVGTTTFGKGIVQTMITYPEDGAGMQLTTASYFSPLGRSIHQSGVTPDVVVPLEAGEDFIIDVQHPDPERDNQLKRAVEELGKLMKP